MDLNKTRTGVEEKFFELCKKVVPEQGYELYDMEYIPGCSTLRVYIMDPKTKTAVIEDCVAVDRAMSPFFEEEEWIPQDIILEVSSPGVYRNIKSKEHFEQSIGDIISCTLSGDLNPEQLQDAPKKLKGAKKLRGTLKAINETNIVLDIENFECQVDYSIIKKVHHDPEF